MTYLLYEKTKSHHKNVIGLFEQKSLAEIFVKMYLDRLSPIERPNVNLVIEKVRFLDQNPELIEFVLKCKRTNSKLN